MAKYVPPARAHPRERRRVAASTACAADSPSVSGLPVHRRDDPEATARGIGYLAAGRPAQWNIETGGAGFRAGGRSRAARALSALARADGRGDRRLTRANHRRRRRMLQCTSRSSRRPGIVRAHDMAQLRFLTSLILFPVPATATSLTLNLPFLPAVRRHADRLSKGASAWIAVSLPALRRLSRHRRCRPRSRASAATRRATTIRCPSCSTHGDGCWLWDEHGRRYLDMMSAYSAVSHGHAHPRIVRTLVEQAQRLAVTSRAFHNDRSCRASSSA